MDYCFKQINAISEVGRERWQQIISTDFPFVNYDYLEALESSGSVCSEAGWTPAHIVVEVSDEIIAVMPLYLKSHSYGEYVFDFQWANTYHQNGVHYYPKLVAAIPFTPVTGERFYLSDAYSHLKSL